MPFTRIYVNDTPVAIQRFGRASGKRRFVSHNATTPQRPRIQTLCRRGVVRDVVLPLLVFVCRTGGLWSQTPLLIHLPDVSITADKVTKGDGDTYGFGDWHCRFKASIEGPSVLVEGELVFSEKANDFTTLVGTVRRRFKFAELEACRHCRVVLDEPTGSVGGINIGARGARWYRGQGLIRRAKMTTDTFGEDVGRVGGVVQFVPLRVLVHCDYVRGWEGERVRG